MLHIKNINDWRKQILIQFQFLWERYDDAFNTLVKDISYVWVFITHQEQRRTYIKMCENTKSELLISIENECLWLYTRKNENEWKIGNIPQYKSRVCVKQMYLFACRTLEFDTIYTKRYYIFELGLLLAVSRMESFYLYCRIFNVALKNL